MQYIKLKKATKLDIISPSGGYYSCMECDWEGGSSECEDETFFDEFKGIDRKCLICPKCGGGLDC